MRRTLSVLLASSLALGLAGCGDDSPDEDPTPAAAAEETPATAEVAPEETTAPEPEPAAPMTMAITMGAPTEFAMVPETAVVAAGTVTLDVRNEGAIEHEVVVIPTELDSGDLPLADEGGAVEDGAIVPHGDEDHEGQEMEHAGVHFDTGKSGKVSLDLEPGKYAVVCNLPGHYESGMHANFEVR